LRIDTQSVTPFESLSPVHTVQKSATVTENGETTAKFGDSRTFMRQCGEAFSYSFT